MSEKVNAEETPLSKEYFDIQMTAFKKENGNGFAKVFEYLSKNADEWNRAQRVQDHRLDKLERESKRYRSKRDIIILSIATCGAMILVAFMIYDKFIR